ncbi:hypothetical protein CWT12_01775 [Actinomyces sp. 432]|uniref:type II toxin-antitoxin system Phd/YefM family antitoxin n=1 Tax=Actinomyces sp. 432 TaxID=2057798 RepID=UPI001373DC6E|nr:hypothetical protein [Actinomyces sp. 432]QHO90324.1 hypothetical protein CWT12_01775 [Actinomyces sp. 432]
MSNGEGSAGVTRLSALLAEVEGGATVNIARGSRTVARLVSIANGEREFGFGDEFLEAVHQVPHRQAARRGALA